MSDNAARKSNQVWDFSFSSAPGPGGTRNVQPSTRPRKLPRIRRGMSPGRDFLPRGHFREITLFKFIGQVVRLHRFSIYAIGSVRGSTSTSQPFDVGMPVPSVVWPINRQVGGP